MANDPYLRTACRYCDAPLEKPFLELGSMPLANNLITEGELRTPQFECPLSLVFCPTCALVQLSHKVPPEKMFSHYLYVSSTTQTFRDHFAAYAAEVRKKLQTKTDKPVAVDIGSNDGLLVSCYQKEGLDGLGVDPAKNLAEDANRRGIKTINRFFDAECVRQIIAEHGKAHVVSGNNVFAHIDGIQEVCRNVRDLLANDGMFVIEFPYLVTMLDTLVFDMIYHEHASYIGILSLRYLLKRFGFEIFDIQQVSSHGGSLRVFIQKSGGPYQKEAIVERLVQDELRRGCDKKPVYDKFAREVLGVKDAFMKLVADLKRSGKTITGYGAPAKASTIVNFYKMTASQIDYVVDDNPLKQGMWIPGPNIPIKPSSALNDKPSDYVILFAWNFAREILSKIGHLKSRGVQFLVPLIGPDALRSVPAAKISPFIVS